MPAVALDDLRRELDGSIAAHSETVERLPCAVVAGEVDGV